MRLLSRIDVRVYFYVWMLITCVKVFAGYVARIYFSTVNLVHLVFSLFLFKKKKLKITIKLR